MGEVVVDGAMLIFTLLKVFTLFSRRSLLLIFVFGLNE